MLWFTVPALLEWWGEDLSGMAVVRVLSVEVEELKERNVRVPGIYALVEVEQRLTPSLGPEFAEGGRFTLTARFGVCAGLGRQPRVGDTILVFLRTHTAYGVDGQYEGTLGASALSCLDDEGFFRIEERRTSGTSIVEKVAFRRGNEQQIAQAFDQIRSGARRVGHVRADCAQAHCGSEECITGVACGRVSIDVPIPADQWAVNGRPAEPGAAP
ncbi:MAG: hypothetical protein HY904_02355 [Deltaproteobacteria bacterium]|nr:hypothetical protein [Deltaproteobacteria bacterium]